MKAIYKFLFALLPLVALSSCSKDDPFPGFGDKATGTLSTRSLMVELQNKENVIRPSSPKKLPKFVGEVSTNDFDINIIPDGQTEPLYTYKYAEMPEIVTLPVGKYIVRASYGENQAAAFDAPYFKGEKEFEIRENEITDNIGLITAKFSNVRVTILFDPVLVAHMSADSKVTVKVGDQGSLDFTVDDQDRSGYFAFVEGSHTLAAEFSGKIDGAEDSRIVTFADVAEGNHYRVTFRLATMDSDEFGQTSGALTVDGTIERTDMNVNVEEDWEAIEDDRNQQEEEPDPVNPDDPTPEVKGPQVKPAAGCNLDLNGVNLVDESTIVALDVTSNSGFSTFEIIIDNEDLADLLENNMGVRFFDLINPSEGALGAIHGLKLLPADKNTVKGDKYVKFDVSEFMPLLMGTFPSGTDCLFILKLADAEGENTVNLKLRIK